MHSPLCAISSSNGSLGYEQLNPKISEIYSLCCFFELGNAPNSWIAFFRENLVVLSHLVFDTITK